MNLSHYCGEILVHYLHFNSATVDGFQTWKIYSRLFYCIFAVKNLRLCLGHAETPSFCILRHLVTNSFSGRAEWFFFFTHGDSKLSRLLNSRAIPSIHTNPNMFDCTFNLIFCNSRYYTTSREPKIMWKTVQYDCCHGHPSIQTTSQIGVSKGLPKSPCDYC